MDNEYSLSIKKILSKDWNAIEAKRQECTDIHNSGNIRAAGNQFEQYIRTYLSRKFPPRFRITHGHIISSNGKTSPQFDVLIVDANDTPSIFVAEDDTEYVPFDSVYAVGEIKANYYKSDRPLEIFSNNLEALYSRHTRKTPDTESPLLAFVLFGSFNNCNFDSVAKYFNDRPIKYLPGVICWLDKGAMLYYQFTHTKNKKLIPWKYYPCPYIDDNPEKKNMWGLSIRNWKEVEWEGNEEDLHVSILAEFLNIIWNHLNRCKLRPPDLSHYLWIFMAGITGVQISKKDIESINPPDN